MQLRDDSALRQFASSLNETLDLLLMFSMSPTHQRAAVRPMLEARVHELQVVCTSLREYLR